MKTFFGKQIKDYPILIPSTKYQLNSTFEKMPKAEAFG